MDSRARLALEQITRQAVAADLDALHTELAALRRTVRLLERATGLASDRLAPDERLEQVRELRSRGLSTAVIAKVTGVHPQTVVRAVRTDGRVADTSGVYRP